MITREFKFETSSEFHQVTQLNLNSELVPCKLLKLQSMFRENTQNLSNPVLVQCRSGNEKSAIFIALGRLLLDFITSLPDRKHICNPI